MILDPFALSLIAIVALALLGLSIGHAMIASSILYLWLAGLDMGTAAEQILNGLYSGYLLLAVPMFMLAAEMMNTGKMTERLLHFSNAVVGRFCGDLGQVNVLQSLIFAGMSGLAVADAAGTGRMMQKLMTNHDKYPAIYAAALTAATAVIGPIITPSIPLALYALVSDASIGFLFIAGILPGFLLAFGLMSIVAIDARRKNFPVEEPVPMRQLPGLTLCGLLALMLPAVLLIGIRGGVMTPTEAAGVAAGYALFMSIIIYRSVSRSQLYGAILSSGRTTASIGMLLSGAMVFNYVVTVENIPQSLAVLLLAWDLSPMQFLILVN